MSALEKTSGAGDEARVSWFREPAGVVPVRVVPPAPESTSATEQIAQATEGDHNGRPVRGG